jgi:broad specificity phosphatase PhoE
MNDRTILTLVRHGETPANLESVWHGSVDTPLTERGVAQAERVASYLAEHHSEASALYSSPLQRAQKTAAPIGRELGLENSVEADLTEFHLGSWEGVSYAELATTHKLWENMSRDPDFAPHGGESPSQVAQRFSGVLRDLCERHRGERVVVVTHGGALSIGLAMLIDGVHGGWAGVMNNCAVSELVLEPQPKLLRFNHTEHLEDL